MHKYTKILSALIIVILIASLDVSSNTITGTDSENRHSLNAGYPYEERALGGCFFLGYGVLNGNISEFFTNPVFIGLNIEILRRRLVLQVDDYIGFGMTRQRMIFPDHSEWGKDNSAMHFMLGANAGYTLLNSQKIKVVPLAGIGIDLLTSSFLTSSDNSKNQLLPYYKIGCYIDIKALKLFKNHVSFNTSDSYTCLRLSAGLNSPIGTPKHSKFYKGSMFYISLGMGGLVGQ